MLGKMIKHEFHATARLFLPLFVIVIVLTPVLGVLFRLARLGFDDDNIFMIFLGGISMSSYVMALFVAYVAAFLFIAIRYYRTTATSEAYLTFCLPVNPHQVLISKLVVGFVWQIATTILLCTSIYFMVIIQGVIRPGELTGWISHEIFGLDAVDYLMLARLIIRLSIMFIIGLISGMLQYFLAITLGQLFNEHRVVASIGMYVAIYTGIQIVSTVVMVPAIMFTENAATHYNIDQMLDVPGAFFNIISLECLVLAVVFYFVTAYLLKKRLNVR